MGDAQLPSFSVDNCAMKARIETSLRDALASLADDTISNYPFTL